MRAWPPLPCPGCLRAAPEPNGLCGGCWRAIDTHPGVHHPTLIALGAYRGRLGRAVRAGKFRPAPALLRALGLRLAQRIQSAWPNSPDWTLVAVPSDPARRRQRGVDHTAEILAGLAQGLALNTERCGGLMRSRHAPTQSTRHRTERTDNIAYSMRWQAPPLAPSARVLLVDDVITSGASAREARRALRAAGIQTNHMAVIAIANHNPPAGADA